MKEVLIQEYNNLKQLNLPFKKGTNTFKFSFVNGPFIEILGPNPAKYTIRFTDMKTGKVRFDSEITNNMWTRSNLQYFVKWKLEAINKETNEVEFEHTYDATGKRVYIHLDSSAIGDTLAWFPYIDEFRKKHNCNVVCSTFHNKWFKDEYPELEFVEPSTEVFDLYAMYTIGWYYDEDRKVVDTKIPIEFKQHPLGETSTSILGLPYTEIRPRIVLPKKLKQMKLDSIRQKTKQLTIFYFS